MSPLLRGAGGTNSTGGQLKKLEDFIKEAGNNVPREDKKNFNAAYKAQINKDNSAAEKFYKDLLKLEKYNSNKAIKYNLKQLEK